jgi:DNA-binding transcriptional MerR regulator
MPNPSRMKLRPSDGKTPIDVVIALNMDAGTVRVIYYHYWELKGMYELAGIYDELGADNLLDLIKIYKKFKDLGMNEHDIRKVLELVKHNELENLQWKVEYLKGERNMLEWEKTNVINHILKLNKTIDEFERRLSMYSPWLQNRGEMTHMNQGTESYNNTNNIYPIPYWYDSTGNSYPWAQSYTSFQLSYSDYWP